MGQSEPDGPVAPVVRTVLADDTVDLRFLLRTRLDGAEFAVVAEADDGEAAVHAVAKHRPDLVVLDAEMPMMNGLQALARIRPAHPRTVIVMFSGFSSQRVQEQAIALGADGFIGKGGTLRGVVEELRSIYASSPRRSGG